MSRIHLVVAVKPVFLNYDIDIPDHRLNKEPAVRFCKIFANKPFYLDL
jgi:hypothetical protein